MINLFKCLSDIIKSVFILISFKFFGYSKKIFKIYSYISSINKIVLLKFIINLFNFECTENSAEVIYSIQ